MAITAKFVHPRPEHRSTLYAPSLSALSSQLRSIRVALIVVATIFYWLVEGWSLLDAVYFSVVTIATVGYGDLAPETTLGKLFTIGFIFSGIGLFVAAVTAVAQAILRAPQTPPQ